jgi:transcriptional regulator with XRE-family HTH domain
MNGVSRFGIKLRHLRKQHNLTQQALGLKLGFSSHSYLSEVEKGWKEPSLALVLATADLFGVTTDQLLRDHIRLEGEDDDTIR